ncbi:RNA-binding S4 domain-containing protein [Ruania suaedae]|uniref:RNA-binding S4 domain-containing protein n=1 Tax=Ruania suaedae TaxID=2897774 RepID=UPI001E30A5A5|nr:RNA-binding S4 domain-containing protein [Ruania suaedae]UFU04246.1 RNA-binding S4 domain-containing protein [Ruania suaedae]
MTRADVQTVPISDEMIRLGQLLKLAGLVEDGAGARLLLADEAVRVNGQVETRRGRQLVVGDEVEVDLPTGACRLQVTG